MKDALLVAVVSVTVFLAVFFLVPFERQPVGAVDTPVRFAEAGRPKAAIDVDGAARVIDGDTVDIGGQRIRLFGIDAPERKQTCRTASDHEWQCGQVATYALMNFIGRHALRCENRGLDVYGRIIAVCFDGSIDVNRWMVENGWAIAYRHFSWDYVASETTAQAKHAGIWVGTFVEPWIWRQQNRRDRF